MAEPVAPTLRALVAKGAPSAATSRSDSDDSARCAAAAEGGGSGEPRDYGPRVKLLACGGLVCVQVFAASVLKLAQRDGVYLFSPQSSLVLSETIKCGLSAVYLARERGGPRGGLRALRAESAPALVLHMAGLAALYAVNNALMFWLFARADPGAISLVKSGATVLSAALLFVVRGMRLSPARWTVLFAQMVGLLVAQYDACRGRAHLATLTYGALAASLLNSSVANVWNEFVVKRFEGACLASKNVLLYLFGALLNAAAFAARAHAAAPQPRFWQGYGAAAVCVVLSNALMGIAMNVVYKYADAVVKNIATTTTTVVLLVASSMFFAGRSDLMVFLGTAVVIIGTYLYFSVGVLEARVAEMERAAAARKLGDDDDGV